MIRILNTDSCRREFILFIFHSIISGPKQFPGIFIETVRPGSLGEDYELEVGDQIIEVNGKSFLDIRHKEAIVELKGSKELNMVIKKGVVSRHFRV